MRVCLSVLSVCKVRPGPLRTPPLIWRLVPQHPSSRYHSAPNIARTVTSLTGFTDRQRVVVEPTSPSRSLCDQRRSPSSWLFRSCLSSEPETAHSVRFGRFRTNSR